MIAAAMSAAMSLAGAAAALPAASRPDWPQQHSDLPANKAVRFGVLANGMRYAILANPLPRGHISLRLRIGAGSLNETGGQLGMAHFLEHMAFRGSTHVPSGEAMRMLERLGLAVGADANAFTDLTQTVYKFDMPSSDGAKLDTALMLMRETASELTLTDAAFDAERPVVLAEERVRAGPERDRQAAELGLLFEGQLAAARLPIGNVALLRTIGPEPLRAFYHAYYRPERAVLVVVGDVDPGALEARIKSRFGDWTNAVPAPADPDYGAPSSRAPAVRILAEAGLSPQINLAWVRPFDRSRHDKARLQRIVAEQLAMNILSARINAMAASENSPFAATSAAIGNRLQSGMVTTMRAIIKPDQWQNALRAMIIAQRQITASSGVSRADLDTALAMTRATLQARAAAAETRSSASLADELVASVDAADVFTADADDLALFEEIAATITAEQVSAAARAAFSGGGPRILLSGSPPLAAEADVLKALAEAETVSTSNVPVSMKAWPYTQFGPPGRVAERRHIADLDFTAIRFANGVRLNVKQTDLAKDQILIGIRFGSGRQALRQDRAPLDWTISGWLAGGLKGISLAEQQRIFAGKVHREAALPGDDAFQVSAATRPVDFALETQLLAAYMTAPAWRADAFDRVRSVLAGMMPQLDTSPGGVMRRELGVLLHAGDRRWAAPSASDLATIHVEDARALIDPQLAAGPLEITIVGDVAVDRAIELVAATFGTLAPERAPAHDGDPVRFPGPAPRPVTLHHGGRADQGIAFVAWPIGDLYADLQRARALDMLARIVSQRLFDQVRVAQGATYTTGANADPSAIHRGYGTFAAFAETPPEKVQSFYATLDAIIADLKAREVGADEFARVRTPMLEQLATARRSNGYWVARLGGSQAEPRQLDLMRTSQAGVERLTPADIRRAAQDAFDPARIWRLQILPSADPAAAAAH